MRGRYLLHPDQGYLVFEIEGEVTPSELHTFFEEMVKDPQWSPEFSGLGDYTHAHFDFTFGEVLQLTDFLRSVLGPGPVHAANVVGSEAEFGMVRMFQTLSDEFMNVKLFRDRREAEAWIRDHSNPISGTTGRSPE